MANTGRHYVARKDTGAMLCKDGLLREFAGFGTYSSCVKSWRKQGFAMRKARHLNAIMEYRGQEPVYFVITLQDGWSLDAAGHIFAPVGDTGNQRKVCHLIRLEIVDNQAVIPQDQA